MIEKEVRGFIRKKNFKSKINYFTEVSGKPKYSKRLSLALADYEDLSLETKIRITNGSPEIVQKVGDFTAVDREEITITLSQSTSKDLFNLYKTYRNFQRKINKPMLTIIQHENYVFSNSRVEVKLFRQFGNEEFFAFEVEALTDMEDSELESFCIDNNLQIDIDYNDLNSVQERNNKVNIDPAKISDAELIELLDSYLSDE